MRRHEKRTEQAALFRGKDDEEQRALRPFAAGGIRGVSLRQFDHAHSAVAVVIGAMPDLIATDAVVIVMAGEQDGFCLELWVAPFEQTSNVVTLPSCG